MSRVDAAAVGRRLAEYVAGVDVPASAHDLARAMPDALAEIHQLRDTLAAVEQLCRSYTPVPPPIFRDPKSEFGEGLNAGTRTLAQAVLLTLGGEPDE